VKIVMYMPSSGKNDPSKKFATEQECWNYIFSRMCSLCKRDRELYLEMVKNGYDYLDKNLPEKYYEANEYPGCSAEWMVVDEEESSELTE